MSKQNIKDIISHLNGITMRYSLQERDGQNYLHIVMCDDNQKIQFLHNEYGLVSVVGEVLTKDGKQIQKLETFEQMDVSALNVSIKMRYREGHFHESNWHDVGSYMVEDMMPTNQFGGILILA